MTDVATVLPEVVSMSAEEYLAAENDGEWRHEFVNGAVYAMVGSSARHNIISINFATFLSANLPDHCQVFATDMKLRIKAAPDERYYYPDVVVSCSPADRDEYTRAEPVFVTEVLSPWTERTDRGEKADAFRRIPTVVEYVLVSQSEARVELFRRRTGWQREIFGLGETMTLESVDLVIPLAALYRRSGLLPSD